MPNRHRTERGSAGSAFDWRLFLDFQMKTLGLIGGTGPESTIDYYRLLTNLYHEKAGGASPHIIINSINLKQMIDWMGAGELGKVTDELVKQFEILERAGVDFAALTANTPHIVFDDIKQRVSL